MKLSKVVGNIPARTRLRETPGMSLLFSRFGRREQITPPFSIREVAMDGLMRMRTRAHEQRITG